MSQISCPKCGFEQEEADECARCGVIFAKVAAAAKSLPMRSKSDAVDLQLSDTRAELAILLVLLLVLGLLLHHQWITRELKYPPGVLIGPEPRQIMIKNPVPWRKDERLIVPLALFALQARVLSKEKYDDDPTSDISPLDLALGWGPMSDQKILDQLEITQGGRRFMLTPLDARPPLPLGVLMAHSSNMHMLPANEQIEKTLDSFRVGELVELSGYLVGVQESGQWIWVSSLSRTDVGDGACEIFWVEHATALSFQKH